MGKGHRFSWGGFSLIVFVGCSSSSPTPQKDAAGDAPGDAGSDTSSDVGADVISTGDRDASPDGGDPYFDNVVLLMHFDGDDASTTFIDVKGHAVMPSGGAKLTAATKAFGTGSGAFDGTSAYLTLMNSNDWNFGSADFTVEMFVKLTGGPAAQHKIPTMIGMWGPTAVNQSWQLLYNVSFTGEVGTEDQLPGDVYLIISTTGSDEVVLGVPWTPAADVWYHLAAVRHGDSFLYFVDGALIGSASIGGASGVPDWTRADPASNAGPWSADGGVAAMAAIHPNTAARLAIGAGVGAPGEAFGESYLHGFIDEVRITKGVARYTASFTVPTGPFADR